MQTTTPTTKPLSKTAAKREAARLMREINARQKQLTSLRSRDDGGGGYGEPGGVPTLPQQLVNEMHELGVQRRKVLGEPAW